MSNLRQAAEVALEALGLWATGRDVDAVELNYLIFRLEAALAEPLTNQCGETCERAKLCAVCACDLAEPVQSANPIGAVLKGPVDLFQR